MKYKVINGNLSLNGNLYQEGQSFEADQTEHLDKLVLEGIVYPESQLLDKELPKTPEFTDDLPEINAEEINNLNYKSEPEAKKRKKK